MAISLLKTTQLGRENRQLGAVAHIAAIGRAPHNPSHENEFWILRVEADVETVVELRIEPVVHHDLGSSAEGRLHPRLAASRNGSVAPRAHDDAPNFIFSVEDLD